MCAFVDIPVFLKEFLDVRMELNPGEKDTQKCCTATLCSGCVVRMNICSLIFICVAKSYDQLPAAYPKP